MVTSPAGKTTWRVSLCAETGRYLSVSKRVLSETQRNLNSRRNPNTY
jgi:hypothetical protein